MEDAMIINEWLIEQDRLNHGYGLVKLRADPHV